MIAATWSGGDTALAAAVVVLLTCSGFFAMAETALVRMSKTRARALREEGHRGARTLVRLADAPESFLNPLLLLVLVCQLVSATMVGVLAGHLFGAAGVLVATGVEVVIIFVLFEAIPKNFAVAHLDATALATAPVIGGLLRFWPIRWVSTLLLAVARWAIGLFGAATSSPRMTDNEILAMADVAAEDEVIASEEREFIHSVIEFGDTVVREVMVPRPDMVVVDAATTVTSALDLAVASGRSRLPVAGEGVDDVVGLVNLRHLAALSAAGRGGDAVGPHAGVVHFVPETKKVASLLAEFSRLKSHLFVVVDEYGGTAGLVTLEDVLEELVGEITDESDAERPASADDGRAFGAGLTLSGRLNVDDANDEYELDLPRDGWDTVGGLVLDLAGGVPAVGDSFEVDDFRLTVKRVEGRRVEEVLVEHLGPAT